MKSRLANLAHYVVCRFLLVAAVAALAPQAARAVTLPVIDGSLQLWLDASSITGLNNGDPVGTWADRSGNFNSATQATAGARPTYVASGINGLPTVRFDGNDFIGTTPASATPTRSSPSRAWRGRRTRASSPPA